MDFASLRKQYMSRIRQLTSMLPIMRERFRGTIRISPSIGNSMANPSSQIKIDMGLYSGIARNLVRSEFNDLRFAPEIDFAAAAIFAVVIACPTCRCVWSATWTSNPPTVVGSCFSQRIAFLPDLSPPARAPSSRHPLKLYQVQQKEHRALRPDRVRVPKRADCSALNRRPSAYVSRRSRLRARWRI